MGKGTIGTPTNVIIKVPKRIKLECNCKKCIYYKKTICELRRKLFPLKCKWYTTRDDYNLTKEEINNIKKKNNISKTKRKERSTYNKGFGTITVEKADLSKYSKLK